MRGFLIAIPLVLIVMSMSACQGSAGPSGEQGPPGPVGPAGPTGEAATLDKDELQLVLQQLESAEARITADGPASGQQLMPGQTEASVPPKWMPEAYTNYFVREAIRRYESDGLDSTVAYYNTKESVDGQWYVFMIDEDGTVIAHANPALVGQLASDITGPNNYPTGAAVAATADENGAWWWPCIPWDSWLFHQLNGISVTAWTKKGSYPPNEVSVRSHEKILRLCEDCNEAVGASHCMTP